MNKAKSDKYYLLLNAAGAVFARLGFYKSTISQIAAEAGVADGTIYLYFKNKDDRNLAVIFQSEVRYRRDLAPQIKDISKVYLDFLSGIIEQGQIEGGMRQDLFMGLVKLLILGSVEGVISTWVASDGKYDLVSMADPLVDLYLKGIQKG